MYQMQQPEQQPLLARIAAFLTRGAERFVTLLRRGGFEFSEFYGALITTVWGAWVLFPFQPDTFSSSPSFRGFLAIAPEWAWGLIAFVAGSVHLCLFVIEHRVGRVGLCGFGLTFWLFLGVVFWTANHSTTAVPLYILQALPFVWSMWRLFVKA